MKFSKKFILGCCIPWLFIAGYAACTLDRTLLSMIIILSCIELVAAVIYLVMPMLAGCMCILVAKHYEFFEQLAMYSASLRYEAMTHGGYHRLYKRGVNVYKATFRKVNSRGVKSKATNRS